MINKILLILLISVLNIKSTNGQQFDTTLILKHLKIRLFAELKLHFESKTALNDYCERKLQVTILKSNGFDSIFFFKISNQILAIDSTGENNRILTYSTPVCLRNGEECYFVYAYNSRNNSFFRLKGTRENDFTEFYNSLQNQWMGWITANKISNSKIKQFTSQYWIENLDLTCLLLSISKKQGKCLEYYSPGLNVH
jgi:hypothetical protein